MAELDKSDPKWRIEDYEAQREVIPDDQNSALCVAAASQHLATVLWPVNEEQVFEELKREKQLNEPQVKVLRALMEKTTAAREEGRKLKDRSKGRFAVVWTPDGISTRLSHLQDARNLANLLKYDAWWRAQQKDWKGAMESCQALVNDSRSIGDEPTLISVLVRVAIDAIALGTLERVLAQGEPGAEDLAAMQRLLEMEEKMPLLENGMRGERGLSHRAMQALSNGWITPAQLVGVNLGRFGQMGLGNFTVGNLVTTFMVGSPANAHADVLEYTTELVEAAKLPEDEQPQRLRELEASAKAERSYAVQLLAPALSKVDEAIRRNKAMLRTAIVALAAERYRREHGRWPETPDELMPKYLAQALKDPYDGRPIRIKKTAEGLVVYSVGPDGQDDGGKIGTNPMEPGTDIGFRLWDVAKRRQPPDPPKPMPVSPEPDEP
jgi:hypothetical protein